MPFNNKNEPEKVKAFIIDAPPHLQTLMWELRHLILQLSPAIVESIKWKIPFFSYKKDGLCYINPQKTFLYLGFYRGAALSNNKGLLEGDGKQVRLFKISTLEDIYSEALHEIFQEAILFVEMRSK